MGKVGKIAIVVVLAVVVVAVLAMKKGGSASTSAQPNTQTAGGLPRLVDLGSTTCTPCKLMAPILEELKKEYAGRMQVEFVDVNTTPSAKEQYRIDLIPTQVFFDANGKELWRHVGFFSKEDILAKWKELGVALDAPVSVANTPPTTLPAVKSGST